MASLKLRFLTRSDAGPALAPNWHPNFRDFERLPDTKVVRTTFFVNVAAITLAVALLLGVGWREYQISALNQQLAEAEATVARNRKANADALRHSQAFVAAEKKIAEAAAFVAGPLAPTDFFRLLGASLPREVQLDFAELRLGDPKARLCLLRGVVAGTKDEASGAASAYVETLRTLPEFAALFEKVELRAITTDPRTGMLSFEIQLRFKPEGKKS